MAVEFGTAKTVFILAIVVGCFAILWPKLFYPMLTASVTNRTPIDNTQACCDVIFENDVKAIKIMTEMCGNIFHEDEELDPKLFQAFKQGKLSKEVVNTCRSEVLNKCGIDIAAFLSEKVRLGQSYKQILDEIRSFNISVCLKTNFGVAPSLIGATRRMRIGVLNMPRHHRQERPPHLRPELLHPALRERGRAIPQSHIVPRVIEKEGRPGPIPGMRPPMGGAGHVVPAPKGSGTMGIIMPIYTIGIVVFFMYTIMKVMFKKPSESSGGYAEFTPDPEFRKAVFSETYEDRSHLYEENLRTRTKREPTPPWKASEENGTRLGWKERDTIVTAISGLLAEVDLQREILEKRAEGQNGSVSERKTEDDVNEIIQATHIDSSQSAPPSASVKKSEEVLESRVSEDLKTELKKETQIADLEKKLQQATGILLKEDTQESEKELCREDDNSAKVKVVGMEMTASCEGGLRWSRPETPVLGFSSHSRSVTPVPPPSPEPHSIFLEGTVPSQTQLLVSDSETQAVLLSTGDIEADADAPVILSGKMTLSLISLQAALAAEDEQMKFGQNAQQDHSQEEQKVLVDEIVEHEEKVVVSPQEAGCKTFESEVLPATQGECLETQDESQQILDLSKVEESIAEDKALEKTTLQEPQIKVKPEEKDLSKVEESIAEDKASEKITLQEPQIKAKSEEKDLSKVEESIAEDKASEKITLQEPQIQVKSEEKDLSKVEESIAEDKPSEKITLQEPQIQVKSEEKDLSKVEESIAEDKASEKITLQEPQIKVKSEVKDLSKVEESIAEDKASEKITLQEPQIQVKSEEKDLSKVEETIPDDKALEEITLQEPQIQVKSEEKDLSKVEESIAEDKASEKITLQEPQIKVKLEEKDLSKVEESIAEDKASEKLTLQEPQIQVKSEEKDLSKVEESIAEDKASEKITLQEPQIQVKSEEKDLSKVEETIPDDKASEKITLQEPQIQVKSEEKVDDGELKGAESPKDWKEVSADQYGCDTIVSSSEELILPEAGSDKSRIESKITTDSDKKQDPAFSAKEEFEEEVEEEEEEEEEVEEEEIVSIPKVSQQDFGNSGEISGQEKVPERMGVAEEETIKTDSDLEAQLQTSASETVRAIRVNVTEDAEEEEEEEEEEEDEEEEVDEEGDDLDNEIQPLQRLVNDMHITRDETPTTTNYTTASTAAEARSTSGTEETAADFSALEYFDDQPDDDAEIEEEVWNGDVNSAEEESEEEAEPQNNQQQ